MINLPKLPQFLEQLIASPPAAGSGVHSWLFDVSRNLHAHLPVTQIEELLRSKLQNCGRAVPDREIKAAISDSIRFAWNPNKNIKGSFTPTPKPDNRWIGWQAESKRSLIEAERQSNLPGEPTSITNPIPTPEEIRQRVDSWPNFEQVSAKHAPRTPLVQPLQRKRLPDLFHESPFWYDSYAASDYIRQLFPGNPLLCCGRSAMSFETKPRNAWADLDQQAFIVPSPMSGLTGVTQDGKLSAHSTNNTGPRRFLVIEFDFAEKDKAGNLTHHAPRLRRLAAQGITVQDICASLLFTLDKVIPITMVVHSGGKSLHGWWFCSGLTGRQLSHFWDLALKMGADPRTRLKSQFIRMPDGTRDNGNRQPVQYFNPKTLPDL